MGRAFDRTSQYISLIVGKVVLLSSFCLIKVPLSPVFSPEFLNRGVQGGRSSN